MSAPSGVIASALLAPLLDGPEQELQVLHRGRLACQLADGFGNVRACVIFPESIRLPHAVVVSSFPAESSAVVVGNGAIGWDGLRHRVSRWWSPRRPRLPALRDLLDDAAVASFVASWDSRLGLGPGLTPYGDDVICGVLVTLIATRHPLADSLAAALTSRPLELRTTATSAGLLRLAAGGYCIDELADYLANRSERAAQRLRSVGHSSGQGLLEGVSMVLRPNHARLAA